MADHFLTKSRFDFENCISVDNIPIIERFSELYSTISASLGEETAALFAEPLVSRGNDKAEATVSWYSDFSGTAAPISKLASGERNAVSALLTERLAALKSMLDANPDNALLAAALHIAGPLDVMSIDGHPVLIGWGMLSAKGASDPAARKAQYERTLGRYLPLQAALPLTDADQKRWQDAAGGRPPPTKPDVDAVAGDAGKGKAANGGPVSHSTKATKEAGKRVPLAAWLPLLLLLALFGGALAWLLVPGNRIFATDGIQPVVTDQAALDASERTNIELRERLLALKTTLDGAQCHSDGTLITPDGETIEGLMPPNPADQTDGPGQIRKASATPILPPDPDRVVVGPKSGQISEINDNEKLLKLIDDRTAMVIALKDKGSSTGTGFFVGPDLLVTNYHVIEKADPERVFVTNKGMGNLKLARIVKTLGPMDEVGADFALLQVEGVNQPAFKLRINPKSLRLQSVIAAGYPSDLLQTDSEFKALKTGDTTAVPSLVVTDGSVATEQKLSAKTNAVVHSAPISNGNSGGPLIDMCGRVVGVNTFVVKGPMRNLNFALASDDLMAFLQGVQGLPDVSSEACVPYVARPSPPAPVASSDPN